MYGDHLVLCGMVWAQFGETNAGMELVRALDSSDEAVRVLARILLQRTNGGSKELLGEALMMDEISVSTASLCGFEPGEEWEIKSLGTAPWTASAEA